MQSKLATLVAGLIAATMMFASGAEAGFKVRLGFGGPLPAFTAYGNSGGSSYGGKHCDKPAYRAARRRTRERVHVARKSAPGPKVAKVAKVEEPAATPAPVQSAQVENSSIATGAKSASNEKANVKQVAAVKEDAVNSDVGCKQFFPSVGMTLSVPCD